MKANTPNPGHLCIPEESRSSAIRERLAAMLKQWRQKLSWYSILALVPPMLVSHPQEAQASEPRKPEASVAGRTARLRERLNKRFSNLALLKRQSEYRLLPPKGFRMLIAFAGNDDCPGRPILEGTYTAAAPFTDSGNTTGANDTVSSLFSYYYYSYDSNGPDHVYSFTLTGRGPNPVISVARTSGNYRPLIYILEGNGGCPAGTGNVRAGWWLIAFSSPAGAATLDSQQLLSLPLNVPFHLFVDGVRNDAFGSGPYTLRIQDLTIAPAPMCPNPNPIDCTDFFVRQNYLDFLGREPDPQGYADWKNIVNNCGTSVQPPCDRIEVASAFFRASEFQGRGYYIYRFYSSVGRIPLYEEFTPDFAKVRGFLTDQQLEAAKAAFATEFMARPEFQNKYGATFNNSTAYVDALLQTVGLPNHPSRQSWINSLNGNNSAPTRAQVLRSLVESAEVDKKYYNEAFVIMQYFGFLHRTADAQYLQWVQTMNQNGGDYRVMINGFLNSAEYRHRFGP